MNLEEWLTRASPSQFFLGVVILVFGSRKILSEKNVSESLGGIFLPLRWIRRMREDAAEKEATEIECLRSEVSRLEMETHKYHRWAVKVTEGYKSLELWAAAQGFKLPPPPFVYWHEFEREHKDDPEEDDGER